MSVIEPTHLRAESPEPPFGFWRRSFAMVIKEFIQLRRDRVSFAMIVLIPVMQLMLFGYAINTTPRNLPTAELLQEDSDLARSKFAGISTANNTLPEASNRSTSASVVGRCVTLKYLVFSSAARIERARSLCSCSSTAVGKLRGVVLMA